MIIQWQGVYTGQAMWDLGEWTGLGSYSAIVASPVSIVHSELGAKEIHAELGAKKVSGTRGAFKVSARR